MADYCKECGDKLVLKVAYSHGASFKVHASTGQAGCAPYEKRTP